jgi:predicted HTH transcriptional regulator
MRDLRLATDYGASIAPTMAGFLLFGRSPAVERALPQNRLTLVRYSGANIAAPIVEQSEFAGNITSLFDRAAQFIRRYVDLWDARPPRSAQAVAQAAEAAPVRARANYLRDAVIEALTNLLVHRDYAMIASPARVLIFDDRLEFINACRTNGTTRKSVEYGATLRLNPRLHHVFTSEAYGIERARRGIPALRRAHFAFTRREPRLSLLNDEFRLELYGI